MKIELTYRKYGIWKIIDDVFAWNLNGVLFLIGRYDIITNAMRKYSIIKGE